MPTIAKTLGSLHALRGQGRSGTGLVKQSLSGADERIMVATPKTYMAKPGQLEKHWYVVDATDCVLGRLASEIAMILMGKHRPTYTPHNDTGDFVVVVNAEKVVMTGNKLDVRHYTWYNGYPRQKLESYADRLERKPTDLVTMAVKRMMPKNALARHMVKKLKVYAGPEHPHQAQQPEPIELGKKAVRQAD